MSTRQQCPRDLQDHLHSHSTAAGFTAPCVDLRQANPLADLHMADYLRPGDTVVIGQATAEPPELVARLIEAAHQCERLTAVCGYSLSDAWGKVTAGRPRVVGYAAHGPLRPLAATGLMDVMPCHYSQLEQHVISGRIPVDVVLLQLPPADADGYHSVGASVDYAALAAQSARVILAEINENLPSTRGQWRLHRSQITASITTDRPVVGTPSRPPSTAERTLSRNVASVIPDGATIQLGIGTLADAIATELLGHQRLRVRSGLVGNWLLDLHNAGALDTAEGACVTGMALGDPALYSFVHDSDAIRFVPISELLSASAVADCNPYVAVNSALEVDLLGQVNSEVIKGRYVGAVGSQVDTFRATRLAKSGLAIVAMAATSPSGDTSQVVGRLSGPVTSLQSDIDLVVTEFGVADLRATTLRERAERLIAVAAPEHRATLRASYSS
ncbi:acetyl-CoA hydrolase/transferase family protein [Rhodococcus jostii]|uniref:acetyl-CoA hydrolase/transferase family protein n=1 Tax=Rhodococcus jostii TaxID=132919 RepID=UPI003644266D